MSASGIENHCAERNHEHIACIDRDVTEDTHRDQRGRQQLPWRDGHGGTQHRIDETGVLGDAEAEHGHEDDAQWRESRERRHHRRHEGRQRLSGQEITDLEGLAATRVDLGESHARQHAADDPREHHQDQEQHRRVGQTVADAFDDIEAAREPPACRRCGGGGLLVFHDRLLGARSRRIVILAVRLGLS